MIRLGIDTGGTYTDAVVIDTDSLEVLAKAKALTTKEDLARGIKRIPPFTHSSKRFCFCKNINKY